jgi:16S rRNA (guanine966-N2)-methyltransferase
MNANITKLRLAEAATVVPRDALSVMSMPMPPMGEPFDLILLDPPYGKGLCARAMSLIAPDHANWLAEEGVIAAQVGRDDPLEDAYGSLVCTRTVTYNQTRIAFYQLNA